MTSVGHCQQSGLIGKKETLFSEVDGLENLLTLWDAGDAEAGAGADDVSRGAVLPEPHLQHRPVTQMPR
jgi:hypothetical protein